MPGLTSSPLSRLAWHRLAWCSLTKRESASVDLNLSIGSNQAALDGNGYWLRAEGDEGDFLYSLSFGRHNASGSGVIPPSPPEIPIPLDTDLNSPEIETVGAALGWHGLSLGGLGIGPFIAHERVASSDATFTLLTNTLPIDEASTEQTIAGLLMRKESASLDFSATAGSIVMGDDGACAARSPIQIPPPYGTLLLAGAGAHAFPASSCPCAPGAPREYSPRRFAGKVPASELRKPSPFCHFRRSQKNGFSTVPTCQIKSMRRLEKLRYFGQFDSSLEIQGCLFMTSQEYFGASAMVPGCLVARVQHN